MDNSHYGDCMKIPLIVLLFFTSLGVPWPVIEGLATPSDLMGLATYYGPPAFCQGDEMANGEPLDLDGATVAVDESLRHLLNRKAVVVTECGQAHVVRVTDLGWLRRAGWFRWGIGLVRCGIGQ